MKTIRIAIADDHKLFRMGLSQILDLQEDLKVVQHAENGLDLMEHVESLRPDVVLLDMEMPVMGGKETLPMLKEKYPDIRVLVLSMHQHNAFIVHMMEVGANGYLLKDTTPQEVIRAIRVVMEDGLYFNSKVSRALLAGLPGSKVNVESNHSISETLGSRDLEVLRLICMEYTTAQIAEELFLSPKTIEGYRKQLLEKTGTKNVAGLAIFAVRNNLV